MLTNKPISISTLGLSTLETRSRLSKIIDVDWPVDFLRSRISIAIISIRSNDRRFDHCKFSPFVQCRVPLLRHGYSHSGQGQGQCKMVTQDITRGRGRVKGGYSSLGAGAGAIMIAKFKKFEFHSGHHSGHGHILDYFIPKIILLLYLYSMNIFLSIDVNFVWFCTF